MPDPTRSGRSPVRDLSSRARRDNNYDLLRLVAATLVIVSHAFALSGRVEPAVPLTNDTLGFDGVLVFFAISGLLITQSWQADPRFFAFAWKRALRILPGLFIACVLTAYAIVPLFSSTRPWDYFSSVRPLRYVFMNTVMLIDHDLPGSFPTNPMSTPNGSLGTLPVEVKAYIVVALVGLAVVFRRRMWGLVLSVAALTVAVASPFFGLASPQKVIHLFAVFLGASLLHLMRRHVPMRWFLLVASSVAWVASYHVPFVVMLGLQAVSVPYIVWFLGSAGRGVLRFVTRPGDLSYGLYIYAFPIQQACVALLAPLRSPGLVIALSFPVTYGLAFASYRLIERPALRWKRLLARPAASADPGVHTQPRPAAAVNSGRADVVAPPAG